MTFMVSAITLGTGRTYLIQGAVHLVLFAAYLFLALIPPRGSQTLCSQIKRRPADAGRLWRKLNRFLRPPFRANRRSGGRR